MSWKDQSLTVAQLIAELQKMPPDALVHTEGCDCNGEAASVILDKDLVLIIRPEGETYYPRDKPMETMEPKP